MEELWWILYLTDAETSCEECRKWETSVFSGLPIHCFICEQYKESFVFDVWRIKCQWIGWNGATGKKEMPHTQEIIQLRVYGDVHHVLEFL